MDTTFHFNYFSIPVILAGLITLALGLMAVGKGNKQGERYFSYLMFACAAYSFFYTLEISGFSFQWMKVFLCFEYPGAVMLGPLLLLFVLKYTFRFNWVNTPWVWLIFALPILNLLLVFTNPLHHLFYVSFAKVNNGYFNLIGSEKGVFYWIHQGYTILLVLISNVLLIRMIFNVPRAYLSQVLVVLTGSLCSGLAYVFYLTQAIPLNLDPVPFSFALSGLIIYLGLFKFGLFRIMPVVYQTLFNNMADGVVVTDASGLLVATNRAAVRLLHLSNRNLGVPVAQVLTNWPELVELLSNHVAAEAIKIARTHPSGAQWLSIDCLPNIHNDVFLGMIIFLRDVTLRHKHEMDLIEKQRITDEQNTKLKSFTYIVSHNIRSHSSNMAGLVAVLKDAETEEERNLYLQLLETSTRRLDETIYNLNEIISVTDMPLSAILVTRNLRNEVEKTLDILKNSILQHQVNVNVKIAADLQVQIVPSYLDSILLNLIGNAIKYRSELRPCTIVISAYTTSEAIVLEVRDNGMGIDLEKYGDKVFGMYKTFHRKEDARGFGLYLTKTQVEALGGNITLESEVEVGSTFRVSFKINS
jgi:signal transduction histidine kinase